MNISDFAKSRGIEPQTVSRYISRHAEDFEGLVTKEGKNVVLSDEALEKLDEVYPNPKPVEIIVDHASRDRLIVAQEKIIQLQQQLADQAALVAEAKFHQLLLEQRDEEIARGKEEIAQQKEEIAQMGEQISSRDGQLQQKDDEIRQLQERLSKMSEDLAAEQAQREQMEKAGLFSRIFKKWS